MKGSQNMYEYATSPATLCSEKIIGKEIQGKEIIFFFVPRHHLPILLCELIAGWPRWINTIISRLLSCSIQCCQRLISIILITSKHNNTNHFPMFRTASLVSSSIRPFLCFFFSTDLVARKESHGENENDFQAFLWSITSDEQQNIDWTRRKLSTRDDLVVNESIISLFRGLVSKGKK